MSYVHDAQTLALLAEQVQQDGVSLKDHPLAKIIVRLHASLDGLELGHEARVGHVAAQLAQLGAEFKWLPFGEEANEAYYALAQLAEYHRQLFD